MPDIVAGFVKNGAVVPNAPLPEGAFVEVHVMNGPIEVPPELQEELDAWERASADALELVERLEREQWRCFGRQQLARAYGPDEPEYTDCADN